MSKVVLNSIYISLMLVTSVVYSQTDSVLQPPRKPLAPLHWPDLTKLEESVREQVAAAQIALTATVKNPSASDAALSEAYGTMGEVFQVYSLNSPARECYLNATRLAPKDFRWIYLLGKLDHLEGRFEEAIRNYRLARTLKPDYLAAMVNLGNIYLDLNRLQDATESFKTALQIDAKNPAGHYGLGQVAISRRNYSEAIEHFQQTLAHAPGANRVHYSLALAYRGLGDAEKVKLHLAQQGPVGVRVSDPLVDQLQDVIKGERLHLGRGKAAFEAGRYAEAASEFRKAVASNPQSVTARVNLGAALNEIGDMDGAAEQFKEALRLEPGKASAHFNLAILLSRRKQHDEAVTHLRAVLAADAGDLSARFLLARELLESGRIDEALVEYSRIVQTNPDNEEALLNQVTVLQRKGQYKQALESLEKAHAQYPQRGRSAVMLAYLLAKSPELELRNGARALDLAQRIYEATGSLDHGALVAISLAELGRCSEAAEWQRRLIATAEQGNRTDLLEKLRKDLKLYEDRQSCRPQGEPFLKDVPLR